MEQNTPMRVAGRTVRAQKIMSSVEDYRGYAAECLRLAQNAADSGDKARLLQMAQAWQDLAEKFATYKTKEAAQSSD